jgi:hypothetical protein
MCGVGKHESLEVRHLIVGTPLRPCGRVSGLTTFGVQGYLANINPPPPPRTSLGPRHSPTVGFWEGGVSYERSTPVLNSLCTPVRGPV